MHETTIKSFIVQEFIYSTPRFSVYDMNKFSCPINTRVFPLQIFKELDSLHKLHKIL